MKSAIRLISAGGAGGAYRCGLHMRLAAQTKTYWRTPGDSGLPPVFDWSRSNNLASAVVSWPVPKRFSDGSGHSIGYGDEVVFPLAVTAREKGLPVRLVLALDYAVCDIVCIPAKGAAGLDLVPGQVSDPALGRLIETFEARVPRASHPDLAVQVVGREQAARPPLVMVRARARAGATPDLFIEGPDTDWALPLPERLQHHGESTLFRLALEGIPRGKDPWTTPFLATLTAEDQGLETTLHFG